MANIELIIGNKKYSSWSLRPWLAMKVKGIAFTETLSRFDIENYQEAFQGFSPTGKVPVLKAGDQTIWESMSILEYLADLFPDKGFWPQDINQRALARSLANEMYVGMMGLRSECPMNMAREHKALEVSDQVRKDVARIEAIWGDALEKSGGPFLFGEFCNVDAMFAPVVNRLEIYLLSNNAAVKQYSTAMKALPAWQEWEQAGRAEPWVFDEDEV